MRYPAEETARKHDRIIKEASRLFRERGFENVTVAQVMKAAGLTHGAFYAHFGSKEDLQAAAITSGQRFSPERVPGGKQNKTSYSDAYLSPWHRDHPGEGCTFAALAQEVARSKPELKAALQQRLEKVLADSGLGRKEAIVRLAAMIGGLVLARAVQDSKLSEEILESVREELGSR